VRSPSPCPLPSHNALSPYLSSRGLVAVAKVESPEAHVLVGTARDEQLAVRRDVDAQDRQLVAVHGHRELERVLKENL